MAGLGDLMGMMRDFGQMRQRMEAVQAELARRTVTGEAGGGQVIATVSGRMELVDLKIAPEAAVPDEVAAQRLAEAASKLGYGTAIYPSPECSLPWTCECSTRMLATYAGVLAKQTELAGVAAQFGGHPDGWGAFGNKADVEPGEG